MNLVDALTPEMKRLVHEYVTQAAFRAVGCTRVDGDRLLIGYCVNKEDLEIGILDANAL